MRAIRYHSYGSPNVLCCEQVRDPDPGPGDLLVRVGAAGVNFADTLIRSGAAGAPQVPLPFTPGFEVAGTVVAVGAGVEAERIGQRVVASTFGGGYAEYAVVTAAAALPIPDPLDERTAAALLAQGSAALGIARTARITADDTVLVPAAAGGVGSLLVQLAKSAGATVIAAVGGEHKLPVARKVGADAAIDYHAKDWLDRVREAAGGAVDVVLDTVGGPTSAQALSLLAPVTGRIVLCGASDGSPIIDGSDVMLRNVSVIGYASATLPPDIRGSLGTEALALAATGKLQPVIGSVLPLEKAAEAHHAIENRETIGKTILIPN